MSRPSERTTETVDAALFTYPGPRPQTREAAILMLSDSTEAAARAARDHSREAIEQLVERIIHQRLEEGQFDDCNLTLRDLTRIKQSFVTLLTGIYHPRIPYPTPARRGPPRAGLAAPRRSVGLIVDFSVEDGWREWDEPRMAAWFLDRRPRTCERRNTSIGLHLVGDATIRELNAEHR